MIRKFVFVFCLLHFCVVIDFAHFEWIKWYGIAFVLSFYLYQITSKETIYRVNNSSYVFRLKRLSLRWSNGKRVSHIHSAFYQIFQVSAWIHEIFIHHLILFPRLRSSIFIRIFFRLFVYVVCMKQENAHRINTLMRNCSFSPDKTDMISQFYAVLRP